jgi:prepilin-type N-terminal cleavage/methylation domain-containing protein
MKNKKIKLKAGFSLIEILAVLFIVSMTLLGVVSLIIQNIQVQSINKSNLIASSLAQEGIELIRHVRDNNWKNNQNFDEGLLDGERYIVDFNSGTAIAVTDVSQTRLFLNNGFYVHDVGSLGTLSETIFSRQVVIDRLNSYPGAPLQVRSIVSWNDRSKPYNYELQALLFDWR